MKFIAYTFKGRKEVRSAAHDTREAAAQELFAANAKLHRVETAVAVQTAEGMRVTFGKDIRPVSRLEAAKALKQTSTTVKCVEKTMDSITHDALKHFINIEGRRWKSAMRKCWETGCWTVGAYTLNEIACFQDLRNERGPAWLAKFKWVA